MTPSFILGVYLHPRDLNGRLQLDPPGKPVPDAREQNRRLYFTYGITDPKTVDRLHGEWAKRTGPGATRPGTGDPA